MENYTIYTRKMEMKEFIIERNHVSLSHAFDANRGKVNSSFAFIKKGSVTLNFMGAQTVIPAGSLFYVPDGAKYNSIWIGKPDIEYYCIHMVTNKYDLLSIENYSLQYIPAFSTPETELIFDEMYRLFSTKEQANMLKALGLYYSFYADVLPYLKKATAPVKNTSLLTAMDYIEKNAAHNFGVDELASFCSISESRLHHLFQTELGTTPIKYRNRIRVENAASDLLHTNFSMEQIAEQNGFHSTTYFREIFKHYMEISPSNYRKKAFSTKGHTI